jgi:hypothetical protein
MHIHTYMRPYQAGRAIGSLGADARSTAKRTGGGGGPPPSSRAGGRNREGTDAGSLSHGAASSVGVQVCAC